MAQIFGRSADLLLRVAVIGVLAGLAGLSVAVAFYSSPGANRGRTVMQPVPFSHQHHVGALGIGCVYCHTSVEEAAVGGYPDTTTCMSCHSQLWTSAEMLEPVRRSLTSGEPIRWNRVHDLPDYVYFNHSIHIAKGVGCESCHGRVDRMPLMRQAKPLSMEDCLACHRAPEEHLRPREDIFAMGWKPPDGVDRKTYGHRLAERYDVRKQGLTDCSTCHR